MPEGPEIRRSADSLARVLQGREVLQVNFAFPHLQEYEARLQGQPITLVESRGKAMLIHFADGLRIYSHNQLYGRWVTHKDSSAPVTNRQIRLSLVTPRGSAWLLSASDIEVLESEASHPYLSKLGPDPLRPETDATTLLEHWAGPSYSRRGVAALFLDQNFLAGVGNYLRSEILFVAGVDPHGRLPQDRTALAHTSIELFRRSHKTGGQTNDPDLVAQLKARRWRRRDYRHWVFSRQGQDCHRCGGEIVKTVLAGRRLYYCPTCQAPG